MMAELGVSVGYSEVSSKESGTASIKPEYLLPTPPRQLNLDYVGNSDRKKLSDERKGFTKSGEPPRKKLKGQNRKRPRESKLPKAEKLCLKFVSDTGCPYGDTCCYSHNIAQFMLRKPVDITDYCYLYETFGKCPYSFTCRFGSKHTSSDGRNLTDENKWNMVKGKMFMTNLLTRELQISLRKRQYDFKLADKILKLINSSKYKHFMESKVSACPENNVEYRESQADCSVSNVGKISDVAVETTFICKESETGQSLSSNQVKCDATYQQTPSNEECAIPQFSDQSTTYGPHTDEDLIRLRYNERKKIDFRGKLYLAPLTTVGNLPFRRICKEFGADITCGEMAMSANLLQGQQSEWALLKRHASEDIFGIQVCGAFADVMTRCAQLVSEKIEADFVDINMGCPIDIVYQKGAGCGMMGRIKKLEEVVFGMSSVLSVPLTVKMRTGFQENKRIAHTVINKIKEWKDRIDLITLHGRSREQRYTKLADWNYIDHCAKLADPIPLLGSGDILSYEDANMRLNNTSVSGIMIARGALIKPWLFTEIKEQRHWDISSSERFDIVKHYANYGLEHWGSDSEGVEKTRRFLLEWLSFAHRYIPVGLLERIPQKINERPSPYQGRNDLETLLASPSCSDWIKISEMFLGNVPANFHFLPKHKANAYS